MDRFAQILETLPIVSEVTKDSAAGINSPLRILDLACGECHEAETLASHFKQSNPQQAIEFVGSDLRAREIDNARNRLRSLEGKEDNDLSFRFFSSDLSKASAKAELGENFDFVLLRHQNYWNDPEAWKRIFETSLSQLKTGGKLLITSYFDQEHLLARQALTNELGAKEVLTQRNLSSRKLVTTGKSVDRHHALFSL